MNINNIIRKLMDEQNVSFATMAARDYKKDGKPKQAKDVAATLCQNKSMAIKTILPYLDSLGYELVVQKKTRGNRREDCIVVTYDVNEPNYKKGNFVTETPAPKQTTQPTSYGIRSTKSYEGWEGDDEQ